MERGLLRRDEINGRFSEQNCCEDDEEESMTVLQ
jgi:hypothetical protein